MGEDLHPRAGGLGEGGGELGVEPGVRPESSDVRPLDGEQHGSRNPRASGSGQVSEMASAAGGRGVRERGPLPLPEVRALDLQERPDISAAARSGEIKTRAAPRLLGPPGPGAELGKKPRLQYAADQSVRDPAVDGHDGPSVADRDEVERRSSSKAVDGDDPAPGSAGSQKFLHSTGIRNVGEDGFIRPGKANPSEIPVGPVEEKCRYGFGTIPNRGQGGHDGSYFSNPRPRSSRATRSRRISEVPAPISRSFASRASRSRGRSFMYP